MFIWNPFKPPLCPYMWGNCLHRVSPFAHVVQLWGTSDPYCVVSAGGSARRSRAVPRCLDPVWDEKIQLYVRCHTPFLQK